LVEPLERRYLPGLSGVLSVEIGIADPLSFAFWLQPISLIWLVSCYDSSITPSLSLLMGSCLKGTALGLQFYLLFAPLQALMASREPGGDAVTTAPVGRDFSKYSRISFDSLL